MKAEKITLYSVLALVGAVVIRDFLKVSVKIKSMAIKARDLQELVDDSTFVALHFNPDYSNKIAAADHVTLLAYIETTDLLRKQWKSFNVIETADTEKTLDNNLNYSAYSLSADEIRKILNEFLVLPDFRYVLFQPKEYTYDAVETPYGSITAMDEDDKRNYVAYEILPADASKNPLNLPDPIAAEQQPVAAVLETTVVKETAVQTRVMALTVSSTGYLQLNPSPPATSNIIL